MTYSIFDSTGNLVDASNDRDAALNCLAGIAQAEPQSASEVFLVAQDDDGNTVGETVYASSASVPHSTAAFPAGFQIHPRLRSSHPRAAAWPAPGRCRVSPFA